MIKRVLRKWADEGRFVVIGVSCLLGLVFSVIVREIIIFYSRSSYGIRYEAILLFSHFNRGILIFALTLLAALLVLLFYVSRDAIYGLLFLPESGLSGFFRKNLLRLVKLLSSLPTLILGNAVLILAGVLNFSPTRPFYMWIFLLAAFSVMALPMSIQLGISILSNYDRTQLESAMIDGASKIQAARKVIFPPLRTNFNSTLTFAVSRIFLEAYIFISKGKGTLFQDIKDSENMLEMFKEIYSSAAIKDNISIIIILFIFAFLLTYFVTSNLLSSQNR